MVKRYCIVLFSVLLFGHLSAKSVAYRVDSLMQTRYAPDEPGAAMMIVWGDSVLAEGYYGIADMETRQPVAETTTFNIASVSKQFTVVGALMLQQRGLLDMDNNAGSFFPEYTAGFWKQVTLKHLASQSSGIPDSRDRSSRQRIVYADDSVSMSYFPQVKELRFAPGQYYDYVNPTFLLIAGVIEQISGEKFVDYQQQMIFTPCGMRSTYYFDPEVTPACQSHGYVTDGDRWKEYDYGEETFFATRPDGGIYSTVRDLALWENALAKGEILADSLVNLAYTPVVSVTDSPFCDYQRRPDTYYAMGWFVDKTPGYPAKVYHTGDNGGYQAYLAKFPSENVAVIVLENRNDQDRWSMATEIDRILKEEGILK